MAKEVAVKIKVDGKEIQVTKELLDLLSNSAEISAEELEQLEMAMKGTGDATKETTKDLDDLDDALKQTTKSTEKNTQAVDEAEREYTSMGERIGKLEDKLATLRLENQAGTEEYKKTAKEIRRLRDVQEELDISTQRTLTTFSQIPGPIGFIAGGFESIRVAAKSARLGLRNLGFSFKTLDKAIASTGIGALVVLFGLLVAAVVKAFNSFKPLQDAVGRFGTLFEVLGEAIQPVIDLIGKALTAALNALSKAIAFVTGNLDE
jgi:methyl-accepting chemotaxis protein